MRFDNNYITVSITIIQMYGEKLYSRIDNNYTAVSITITKS